MNLSSTAQYAIRILSYMALNEEKIFTAAQLVEKLKISDKYLRRLMTDMTKAGLIHSYQGRNGGFSLNKPLEEIYLIDIISAVEDKSKYAGCILGFEQCSDENPCSLHAEWVKVRSHVSGFLMNGTVAQIISKHSMMKF